MNSLEMIEALRKDLIAPVNQKCDAAIEMFQTGRADESPETEIKSFELGWGNPAVLKGKPPPAVMSASGECVEASTWKKAAKAILKECNRHPQMHERLVQISGSVSGRQRVMLGSDPQEMDVPLQIDEDLYFEAKFDTEALIRMLCEKVPNPIGYDYTKITIQYGTRENFQMERTKKVEAHMGRVLDDGNGNSSNSNSNSNSNTMSLVDGEEADVDAAAMSWTDSDGISQEPDVDEYAAIPLTGGAGASQEPDVSGEAAMPLAGGGRVLKEADAGEAAAMSWIDSTGAVRSWM